jgi:nitrogen fixation NifU-like protein
MELKDLYREIVNEHNLNPIHKCEMKDPQLVLRGVNPSCGDDISLMIRMEGNVIAAGTYTGCGCAISQASVDMMLDNVIGLTKEEAVARADKFIAMINGEITDDKELEELDDAMYLKDISHMPARVKCAVLGWRTLKELLEQS